MFIFHKYALPVYKWINKVKEKLVRHWPIQLSQCFEQFLDCRWEHKHLNSRSDCHKKARNWSGGFIEILCTNWSDVFWDIGNETNTEKKITKLFLVTLFRIGFFICSLGYLYLKVCSAPFHSFKVKCGMRWIFGIKFTKFLLKYLILKLVFHLEIFSYEATFFVWK